MGQTSDGTYLLMPDADASLAAVYCDMTTDGGGWTLVASTQTVALNDQASYDSTPICPPWRRALATTACGMDSACSAPISTCASPAAMRSGQPMRPSPSTCRSTASLGTTNGPPAPTPTAASPRWTTRRRSHARSPQQHRRLSLPATDSTTPPATWRARISCADSGDFTVDFDDRGMDGNESDGTDWGEDDSQRKCGTGDLPSGQWFIFARENWSGFPSRFERPSRFSS